MNRPLVTVLMPVHNGADYVSEAVESILRQTYNNYEYLIINDGSIDNTSHILKQFSDRRIILINQVHAGLIAALNYGLENTRGDFVAIMHADDVAHPKRLQKQIFYLEAHQNVGILGSAYDVVDHSGRRRYRVTMPEDDLSVRWKCLLSSPFGHPTVVMRHSILREHALSYDEKYDIVEDYFLWSKVLKISTGANLCSPLLRYRVHPNSRTEQYRLKQLDQQDEIALMCIQQFLPGFEINKEQVSGLRGLFVGGGELISDLPHRMVVLSHLYLDMLEAFLWTRQEGNSGDTLQRKEVIRVASLILSSPFLVGREFLLKRLGIMEPALPILLRWNALKQKINLPDRM